MGPAKELDCIYLDTSNVLLDEELVEKVSSFQTFMNVHDD